MLLAAVLLLDLEMVDQFDPIMRFDGYWALADLVGVPDFYVFMGPVLRGMIPKRWRPKGQEAPPLKGWVKIAFLAYTVIAVPIVFVTFASLLLLAPIFLVTYWNSLVLQWIDFATAWAQHDVANSIVGGVQVAILVLSAYFLGYAVYGLIRTIVRMLWKLGHANTRRQRSAAWLLAVVVALFFWEFWVPQVMSIGGAVSRMTVFSQSAWGVESGDLAPPEQLPTPGQNGFITRTAPSQSTAATSSPSSTSGYTGGTQPSGQTSGVTTTKPASDPSASKSGSSHTGNTGGSGSTHKGGSGGSHNPPPQPTPKPKRTPPPGFPTPPPPPTFPSLP
jgi:putative peptide zinc metalloprotease protein